VTSRKEQSVEAGRKDRSKNIKMESGPRHMVNQSQYSDGGLRFTAEKSANTNEVSYQEASGAPVEVESPLGYSVGAVTIIFLNLSKMIGTGVYSTRESRVENLRLAMHL